MPGVAQVTLCKEAAQAKAYIMADNCNGRHFDNCWENFNADEVLNDLCAAVYADADFWLAVLRNSWYMPKALLTVAEGCQERHARTITKRLRYEGVDGTQVQMSL